MPAATSPQLPGPPVALPPFESLIAAHGATVLRVCRALVGPVDADDVWQETFLAALRAYPGTAHVKNQQAWLVAIARNKCVDHHRSVARAPQPTDRAADGVQDGGVGLRAGEPGRSLEAAEAAGQVWAALAQLSRMQREAVVYHHIAGLRYSEAAALLGNSEVAARRAAADGMKALRVLLAQKEGERT